MSALEFVTTEAEKLDRHSQFLLIEKLARQLGETSEHREAWLAESRKRADAVDRGEMETIPADEVFRQMRNLISSASASNS